MESRPQYVLENHEDEIYHEQRLDALATEPEYCAFINKVYVFNRAMKWVECGNENIACYCAGGDLPLSGAGQVSRWFTDPINKFEDEGDFSCFEKLSGRQIDCVTLPVFQFNLNQHPELELKVEDANSDWQLCVFIKGRSGEPLACSDWISETSASLKFNLKEALNERGYNLQYAELHFVIGTWTQSGKAPSHLKFKLKLKARPALIPCLPVIREMSENKKISISALVVNAKGEFQTEKEVDVTAQCLNEQISMHEENGIWTTLLPPLPRGEHDIKLKCNGAVNENATIKVRITDGNFFSYSSKCRSLVFKDSPTGPMTGSYQGLALFDGPQMMNGQEDWDELCQMKGAMAHWNYWESLTEKELNERFSFLSESGWKLLHLAQHAGIWERLDAGGRISPHGAEQLALYLRCASKHGLFVLQALTHYPYAVDSSDCEDNELSGTPPFSRYLEEFDFKNHDWANPDCKFTEAFHSYLKHYAMLFKDETAVFALSASGEGDIKAGKDRVNSTQECMKTVDPNHLFVSEPIHRMRELPASHCEGWNQELFGSRTYWIGENIEPDIDLGIEYKFMQLGHVFMGEGCWPCWPLYVDFQKKVNGRYFTDNTWAGSERYRLRVRDTLYLGLIHRSPIILTWDEQTAEDERIIFEKIRQSVDWTQDFLTPSVTVKVDSCNVLGEGRAVLAEYEKYFSSLPLNYSFATEGQAHKNSNAFVLDAAGQQRPNAVAFKSEGGTLPENLKNQIPFKIYGDYRANYLWSSDKKTLIAYIYNVSSYMEFQQTLAGKLHRSPQAKTLELEFLNLPEEKLKYELYALNEKKLLESGSANNCKNLNLGITQNDYILLIKNKNG